MEPTRNSELESGKLHDGVIVGINHQNNSYTVKIAGGGQLVEGCKRGSDIVSGLLGFKISGWIPRGTPVKVTAGDPPTIVTCIASDLPDSEAGGSRTTTGFDGPSVTELEANQGEDESAQSHRAHSMPNDLLEGEFEISNMLGVALTMMMNLAKLNAGDRASVEVHLLNEMVRIVSETFRHFSAFGNLEIYNDGRLNAVWNGTSYESESFGKEAGDKGKKLTGSKGEVDLSTIDAVNDTGRWRFSEYIGFMGDFIHQFVSDPSDAIANIAQAGLRAGKARFHINSDGTILMQSVADIVLERVVRVIVPVEKARWDDPTGTAKEEFEQLLKTPLKIWNYGENLKDLPVAAYQLREQARWLSNLHCLQRFHQMPKNWTVPTEDESPVPEWTCKEPDKEAANEKLSPKYKDAYATIRIMRDGSIVLWGTAGESVTMVDGNVKVCATKHLDLEAAGDVRILAGQNIIMTARRSIEIAAVFGGLQLKARTWWHALCEHGSVWIKADAKDPLVDAAPAPASDDDPVAIQFDHAIVLDAPQGRALFQAHRGLIVQTTGSDEDLEEVGSLVVQSLKSRVEVHAMNDVTIRSKTEAVVLKAAKDFLVSARKAFWDLKAQVFAVKHCFTQRGPSLSVADIKSGVISAERSIMGPDRPGPSPGGNVHFNHISKMPDGDTREPKFVTAEELEELEAVTAAKDNFAKDFAAKPPTWNILEQDASEVNYESLTQQRLRLDPEAGEDALYGSWTFTSSLLYTAPRTGATFPRASTKNKQLQLQAGVGSNLRVPATTQPTFTAAKPVNAGTTFKYLKKT